MDLDAAARALRAVLASIEEGELVASDVQHAYIQSALHTLEQLSDSEFQTVADADL